MKKILSIIILVLFAACGSDSENQGESELAADKFRIVGHIENYKLRDSISEVGIYLTDYSKGQISHKARIDSMGNFEITLKTERPTEVNIYYRTWFKVIVEEGKELRLDFDGRDSLREQLYKSAKFSGTGAKVNLDLKNFLADYPLNGIKLYEATQTHDPKSYNHFNDSISLLSKTYAEEFLRQDNLSDVFRDWAWAEIELAPIIRLFQYRMYRRMVQRNDFDASELSAELETVMARLPIIKNNHLVNSELVDEFTSNYFFFVDGNLRQEHKTLSANQKDSIILKTLIDQNKGNRLLAMLAINEKVRGSFKNNDVTYYEQNKNELNALYENSFLATHHRDKLSQIKELLANPVLPKNTEILTFETEDPSMYLNEIIANANGKVIYIDNWATWCGPCKSEFKNSTPALKEKFGNQIEYVYLCYQSKEELWKPTISEYKVEGKHYYIEKGKGKNLHERFSLKGYPTYVLINKKGEIVKSGFEYRPSLPATTDLLNELITEEL